MNLKDYLSERQKRVDVFMERYCQTEERLLKTLFESMRYSLLAGGKRVRPVLVFAAYEACSGKKNESEAALRIGSAIEMIHTYSLIHDDLPAMDNDDLRRGRPTNHKVYGDAMAILAGDSLLTEAFQLIAQTENVDAKILLEISADIAQASGGRGMAGGQVVDMLSSGKKITLEDLQYLHQHKTGCLIQVSVMSGAKLAGAKGAELQAMKAYSESIGLAFQVADDILDVEGGAQEMGKATGGDAKKNKATYPSIIGLEASKKRAAELAQSAISSLEIFGEHAQPLRELAQYIIFRKN